MYVRPISAHFLGGRSTPAILAISTLPSHEPPAPHQWDSTLGAPAKKTLIPAVACAWDSRISRARSPGAGQSCTWSKSFGLTNAPSLGFLSLQEATVPTREPAAPCQGRSDLALSEPPGSDSVLTCTGRRSVPVSGRREKASPQTCRPEECV